MCSVLVYKQDFKYLGYYIVKNMKHSCQETHWYSQHGPDDALITAV